MGLLYLVIAIKQYYIFIRPIIFAITYYPYL